MPPRLSKVTVTGADSTDPYNGKEHTVSGYTATADTALYNVNRDIETPEGWWLGVNPTGFSDRTVRVLSVRSAVATSTS